jgi:DNA-binding CsgD family transcriptional regulator
MAGPVAMILLSVPDLSRAPQEDSLRALFDLTQAEARLVVALCAGETLAGYAMAVGTSLNTVKTHLKHVFDKTGETRQADLVRRISTDLALRIAT